MAGARVTFRLREVDRGFAKLLKAADQMARERGMHAKAGILGAAAAVEHPDAEGGQGKKPTNVQLAAIHEFGVPGRIPARPFIQGTFDLHRVAYQAQLRRLAGDWFTRAAGRGMELRRALGLMGLKMAADMKNRVISGTGIPPPNAPSTVARKLGKGKWKKGGSDASPRPLVDTGRMVGAISHAVESGVEGARP